MTTYRLMRWLQLSGDLDQLKFRRALTAMSVGRVTKRQLREASGLRRTDVALLLVALSTAGALDVEPDLKPAAIEHLELTRTCDIDLPLDASVKACATQATATSR